MNDAEVRNQPDMGNRVHATDECRSFLDNVKTDTNALSSSGAHNSHGSTSKVPNKEMLHIVLSLESCVCENLSLWSTVGRLAVLSRE
jgi:hypothetical protein